MRQADRTLTVGLCVSLILHAAVFYTALGQYVRDLSHVHLGPLVSPSRVAADVAMFDSPNVFGEDHGAGLAAQSEAGDQPMLAPEGQQVQALLSREAQGPKGKAGAAVPAQQAANQEQSPAAAPSAMTQAMADAPSQPPRPQSPPIPMPAPSAPPSPVAPSSTLSGTTQSPADKPADAHTDQTTVAIASPREPAPAPKPPTPQSPSPSPTSPPAPQAPAQSAQPTPAQPNPAQPNPSNPPSPSTPPTGGGGSPVPPSASDSDPFDNSINVVVRPGRVDAATGRKVRTVRPDLTIAAETDLMTAGGGRVQLAVRIDPSGNVADVRVLASSGYPDDIDLPCVQAMHQWWIEPSKDKSGHPVSDVIVITITFQ